MNRANDFTFALRMIRRRPWFSAAIIVTIALGIGINTTVFSLVNAVLFKPLPFPGGERLVMISTHNSVNGDDGDGVSYAEFRDYKGSQRSFGSLEPFSGQSITIGENGNPPERYRGARIGSGMFAMLHAKPVVGRDLRADDETPGSTPSLLIAYHVWKQRYEGSLTVLGRTVRANEKPAVIVGVMPEGFRFPNNEDVWMSAIPDARDEKRDNRPFRMIGMTKPGLAIQEAQADLSRTGKRLEQTYPATNKGFEPRVLTFHEAMNGGPIRLVFLLMMGAVAFVLLIACANVANMLLGRAVERTAEISIRAALGAGRWRLVRQLLIESVLLSAIGGVLGLALSGYGISAFGRATENVGRPYWIDFTMNYTVFGYFAALTILAGVIFGIAPALLASRVNLNETLKGVSRNSAGPRGGYLSGALVVLQFTLAVVLLSGAGLMMRSFLKAQDEFAAMTGDKVLTARISLPEARYPKPDDRPQFFDKLLPQLRSLPGVKEAALVSNLPGEGRGDWHFETQDKLIPEQQKRPKLSSVAATPGYLHLLGVRLLRGRDFENTDGLPGHEAVIITRQFASRYFPAADPLGKQVRMYTDEGVVRPWMTIIGIAPDVRQQNPADAATDPVVFVPYRFENFRGMAIVMRTDGSAPGLAGALRAEVQRLDQDLPLSDVNTLEERFDKGRWYLRVFGTLFLIFAAVATGMAAVGVYGVMANAASRRTREIGVRLALGANAGNILRLVLRKGLAQLGVGVVLGLTAAVAVCRLMSKLLFGVSATDPITYVAVASLLAAVGIAAVWLPARRAARLNPVQALRYE